MFVGAVIMTKVIVRVHLVYLMNVVEQCQVAAHSQTKSTDLGRESATMLLLYITHPPSPFVITHLRN